MNWYSYVIGFFSAFLWLYISLMILYKRGNIDIIINQRKHSLPKIKDQHGFL